MFWKMWNPFKWHWLQYIHLSLFHKNRTLSWLTLMKILWRVGLDQTNVIVQESGITFYLLSRNCSRTSANIIRYSRQTEILWEMFVGTLERNVTLTLTSNDSSAIGMTATYTVWKFHFFFQINAASLDYTTLSTQLAFTIGQTAGAVACANLEIIDDNVVETNEETLILSLSANTPTILA